MDDTYKRINLSRAAIWKESMNFFHRQHINPMTKIATVGTWKSKSRTDTYFGFVVVHPEAGVKYNCSWNYLRYYIYNLKWKGKIISIQWIQNSTHHFWDLGNYLSYEAGWISQEIKPINWQFEKNISQFTKKTSFWKFLWISVKAKGGCCCKVSAKKRFFLFNSRTVIFCKENTLF